MVVYAVAHMNERKSHPIISNYHRNLCAARITGKRSGTFSAATVGEPYPEVLSFAYNEYRTPEILKGEASLLVSERVKEILEKHSAEVEFLPTRVSSVYFVPYEPDDVRHEPYLDMSLQLPFLPIDDAIERHRIDVEPRRFYELAMRRSGQADVAEFAEKKFVYKKEHPFPQSVDAEISVKWVERYKIYACGCYILEEKLHDDLFGLFPWPYYRSIPIKI